MSAGTHPLTGTGDLPNVTVAFPGEHWSDAKASGAITPGEAVIPTGSGAVLYVRPVVGGDDGDKRVCIAKRCVETPDVNNVNGPNEIVNEEIADGEYVHRYNSGVFHLTLVDPRDSYSPGNLIGWDIDGQRPSGKSGSGSWRLSGGDTDVDAVFEVQLVREYGENGEVVLTCRSLNGQF